jgi:acyl carrier protein
MENNVLIEQIKRVICELLNLGNDCATDIDLQLDSLKTVELIVNIESEFGFEFDIANLNFENFRTVDNIITTVDNAFNCINRK